jgi:hypothetical protein
MTEPTSRAIDLYETSLRIRDKSSSVHHRLANELHRELRYAAWMSSPIDPGRYGDEDEERAADMLHKLEAAAAARRAARRAH